MGQDKSKTGIKTSNKAEDATTADESHNRIRRRSSSRSPNKKKKSSNGRTTGNETPGSQHSDRDSDETTFSGREDSQISREQNSESRNGKASRRHENEYSTENRKNWNDIRRELKEIKRGIEKNRDNIETVVKAFEGFTDEKKSIEEKGQYGAPGLKARCIAINNSGSDQPVKNLQEALKKFNIQVEIHDKKDKLEIENLMNGIAMDSNGCYCLIVVIISKDSHDIEHEICIHDLKRGFFPVSNVWQPFTQNTLWQGKARLFFLQVINKDESPDEKDIGGSFPGKTAHHSDIMVIISLGQQIEKFVKCIENSGEEDIESLLKKTAAKSNGSFKIKSTLKKNLYLAKQKETRRENRTEDDRAFTSLNNYHQ